MEEGGESALVFAGCQGRRLNPLVELPSSNAASRPLIDPSETIDSAPPRDDAEAGKAEGKEDERREHEAGRAPTQDNLLVLYIPDAVEWRTAVERMQAAGFSPVPALNPYWDRNGRTFEDPDGYRVVLQNARWR